MSRCSTAVSKAGALCMGALVTFLALELSLRALGFLYEVRVHADKRAREAGATTILCLGDSYTFGMGAPQHQSYPRQLERMLNGSGQGHRYVVVNRGEPAQNSARLVRFLPGNLDTVQPDVVVVMSGLNNIWNLRGYSEYLQSQEPINRLYSLLHHVCVFRLGKLLYYHVAQKHQGVERYPWVSDVRPEAPPPPRPSWGAADVPLDKPTEDEKRASVSLRTHDAALAALLKGEAAQRSNNPAEARRQFQLSISLNPRRREAYLRLAECLRRSQDEAGTLAVLQSGVQSAPHEVQLWAELVETHRRSGRTQLAVDTAVQATRINQESPALYEVMGEACMDAQKPKEAAAAYQAAFDLRPDPKNTQFLGAYYKTQKQPEPAVKYLTRAVELDADDASRTAIPCLMAVFQQYGLTRERDEFLERLQGSHPALARAARALKESKGDLQAGTRDWILHDFATIARMCRERQVKLVLSNYPMGFGLAGDGTQVFEEAAERLNLPLVDNFRVFRGLSDCEAYFAPDGHCNERGYALVAQDVMRRILELQGPAQ